MTREEMADRVAERLVRNRTNGLCPLNGPCDACDCFDPQHRHERDDAKHVLDDLWPEVERLTEERDLAVAHDRQPYPTQWAYDQACAALEKHRQRAEKAEAALTALTAIIDAAPDGSYIPVGTLRDALRERT